ncbi:response regulator [Paenibacillus sp. NPDC058071]|uniref:response regulator n=1 Tax=Paenibacillus sp. NPDC058071 TaxID=3346326 RepID=UPI0036DD1D9E
MQLKVMIVDDEPTNIYGLVKYIKWQELGYAEPVTVESGEEALEILAETHCDVLISDVSMPGMNGIELVARAKEIHPQLQVLIISGYNEFEFVQDAIHVGAQAYVLKPLKLEEVSSRLAAVRGSIDKMRQIVEQTTELEQKITGSLKLVKERFVSDLISGLALTDDLLASWGDLLPLPDCRQGLQVTVYGLDRFLSPGMEAKERMRLGSGFKKSVEIGLSDFDTLFLIQTRPDEMVVLQAGTSPDDKAKTDKQAGFIQRMMNDEYGCTVTVSSSRIGTDWQEVPALYKEARFLMAQARLAEDGQIVRHDYMDETEFKNHRLREEFIPQIVSLIEQGDAVKVSEYLGRMLNLLLVDEPVSFTYVQALGMSFLSELIRAVKTGDTTDGKANVEMWHRFLECTDTEQVIAFLIESVDRYMKTEGKARQNQQHHLIRQVAAFIESHIQESWTVKQLAEQFQLNASYLSVLFKKEMGRTISEFVQDTRIEAAKRLLQNPGIKVYEVAEMVGLQTSAYFTYLFKKNVGSTPQEFRDYYYSGS